MPYSRIWNSDKFFVPSKNMNRSIVALRQLDERQLPDDDHPDRGRDISPAEFDTWMDAVISKTKNFEPKAPCDIGQATIDALRSLKPTTEG